MTASPQDYYKKLVQYAQDLYLTYPSVNSTQIRLDVPRTFSDEAHFSAGSKVG
jgi:hypothetical protein